MFICILIHCEYCQLQASLERQGSLVLQVVLAFRVNKVREVTLVRLDVKVMLAARDHQATSVQLGLKGQLVHQAPQDRLVKKVQEVLLDLLVPLVHAVIVVTMDCQATLAALEIQEIVEHLDNLEQGERTV